MRLFEKARETLPGIGDVRGLGLMLGVELVEPGTARSDAARIREVLKAAARASVILTKCGEATLRIAPPPNITREQIDVGLGALLDVLHEAGTATRI